MIQGTGNYTMSLRFKRIFEKQNYRVLLRSIAGFNIEMKDSCKREIEVFGLLLILGFEQFL
jgi:hypothetical protein